jgi:hypothetical protein
VRLLVLRKAVTWACCMLQWLREPEQQCPWDFMTLEFANHFNHDEMFQLALANGCPLPPEFPEESDDEEEGEENDDAQEEEEVVVVPHAWTKLHDAKSVHDYYWNQETGEVSWTLPVDPVAEDEDE